MRLASSNSDRAAEDCRQDGPFTKPRRVFRLQPIIFSHLLILKRDIKYPIFCLHPLLSLPQHPQSGVRSESTLQQVLHTLPLSFGRVSLGTESKVTWRSSSSCPDSGGQLRHCFYSPLPLEDGLEISGDQDKGSGTCGFKATWIEVRRM